MIRRAPFARRKPTSSAGKRRTLNEMKHSELEALLDAEISLYVRGGAALAAGSPIIRCFTCGRPSHWKSMDCGHFIGRANRGTRWDLRNVRPQCKPCNWTLEGNKEEFARRLEAEIGSEGIESIRNLAAFHGTHQHPCDLLIVEIREWRAKNQTLRHELKAFK